MSSLKIAIIVPRLPPSIDGLGDYGLLLAKQMRHDFSVTFEFIVCDPSWSGGSEVEGFTVRKLPSRSKTHLLTLLEDYQKILLHYVGYGYAKRGCPVWLIQGLEYWRSIGRNRKLVTMFHELYAFGPIWTSQFWTSLLQRNLAARLMRLSDDCLTSKKKYAETIVRMSNGKHSEIISLPVFSNVGEPSQNKKISERKRRLIVFGSRGPRERVFKHSREALHRTCKELGILEIFDIGAPLDMELGQINGIAIKSLGILPPEEISKLLSDSLVGFFNYPTEYLSKSGIFAAYSAHGVLPVGTSYNKQDIDQVEEGVHYLLGDKHDGEMSIPSAQTIAEQAYAWYQTHNLSQQAKIFLKKFEN